jgi:hypothetical protein
MGMVCGGCSLLEEARGGGEGKTRGEETRGGGEGREAAAGKGMYLDAMLLSSTHTCLRNTKLARGTALQLRCVWEGGR